MAEDAAEGLGSRYNGSHLGTFGRLGVVSYNGNKVVTTGGGGMLLTNNEKLAVRAKHLTTTAKLPHPWEFRHDAVAWNYRMPNVNAALGCAQMETLPRILKDKRAIAAAYLDFFEQLEDIEFLAEPSDCKSNCWLNTVLFKDRGRRDEFLAFSNDAGVMTRPLWTLMTDLPMYENMGGDDLSTARDLYERAVSLPSGPRMKELS